MLSVLKTEEDVRRLEKSGRLLRRGFLPGLSQVAAQDVGDKLRLVKPEDAASAFDSVGATWAHIDAALDERLAGYDLVGGAPFWFLGCDDWPGSTFLAAPSFMAWVKSKLGEERPVMVASFSAEQLLLGYGDSAEFHDRLGHVREAPMERPLAPFPFLVRDGLLAIEKIELHLGTRARLIPQDQNHEPLEFALK